jgi:hypothetical protein
MLDQPILIDVLLDAVRFYADPKNWDAVELDEPPDESITVMITKDGEEVPLRHYISGPAYDGGERARVALELAGLG